MIEFSNVSKVYPNGTRALENVDLHIDDGEFVFIVGASGAGKTTLTKLLLCEEKLTSGRLTVGKFNLAHIRRFRIPKLRRTIGVVFQDFRLLPNMTAAENIAFAMHVVGVPHGKIRGRVANFLKLVGLEDRANSKPGELSGGEKQRVALARALVSNPSVIIADEPTANVDPNMAIEIMELLCKINELGKTVIVITHNLNLVNYYQKRVIMLKEGRVVRDSVGGMFEDFEIPAAPDGPESAGEPKEAAPIEWPEEEKGAEEPDELESTREFGESGAEKGGADQ